MQQGQFDREGGRSPSALPQDGPSLLRKHWAVLLLAIAVGLMTAHVTHWYFYGKAPGEEDDHLIRREYGRRFLTGEPLHSDWKCFNYMPTAAMCWAPLAMCSAANSKLLHYLVGVGGLALSLYWLGCMARPVCRPRSFRPLVFAAIAVLLTAHYLGRDLRDGGHQAFLLTLLVGGIYGAWRGRELGAALCLGLAIALKMIPALFVPFLLWKRKWRLAAWTTAATLAWIVAPAAWMGCGSWWQEQQVWNEVAINSLLQRPDSRLEANNTRVSNQALQPALMQLLVSYPPGHPLHVDHAAAVALGLPQETAKRVALALIGSLALVCLWRSRRPYRTTDDPAWPVEASGLLILCLLFSPVTWTQHIGLSLPGVYLLVVQHLAVRRLPRWALISLGIYAILALVLMREVIGLANYRLVLSFHSHTLGMLIILGLLLALRPLAAAETADTASTDEQPPTIALDRECVAGEPISAAARPSSRAPAA